MSARGWALLAVVTLCPVAIAASDSGPALTTEPAPARLIPVVGRGAPGDVGLTVPVAELSRWNGPATITPTTLGVVDGVLTRQLFTSTIYVRGNVTITDSKFASDDYDHIVVQGTATPGPVFSHIEIDGLRSTTHNDDIGITNSRNDEGDAGAFTLDRSHLYQLNNGARLDSNAVVTNTLIDHLSVAHGSHTDGIEIYCGSDITIDHTTIDATNPGGSDVNAAIETQGDADSGGFCPVSNLTFSNDLFSGGTATWRLDDEKITHVTVRNLTIVTGSYRYFATSVVDPSHVDVWENVMLSDGTSIPTAETYGCGVDTSCR